MYIVILLSKTAATANVFGEGNFAVPGKHSACSEPWLYKQMIPYLAHSKSLSNGLVSVYFEKK